MAPYRHWYIPGAGDHGVHVQTADDAIGRDGRPGAYVHNDGKLACLDAAGLDELARVSAEAAADVRRRSGSRQTAEQLRQVMESRRAGGPDCKLTGDEWGPFRRREVPPC